MFPAERRAADGERIPPAQARAAPVLALLVAGWIAAVAVRSLADTGGYWLIGAPPLVGYWEPHFPLRAVIPLLLAIAIVAYGPTLAKRLAWGGLLAVAVLVAAAWALALAWSDGTADLTAPLETRYEYLAAVPLVESPSQLLAGFVAELPEYPTHVKGHPPGFLLALVAMDRVGLAGSTWAAVLVIGAGASAAAAVLVAMRDVSDEAMARRAAPFLVGAPAAVWVATSADALFLGVSAWAVTLVVLATGRRGAASLRLALAGGAAWAVALFLSYGVALLAVVPAALAWQRRRGDVTAVVAGIVILAGLGLGLAGFWWPEGLAATRRLYESGAAAGRPYAYFVWANLVAFGLVLGPAALVALRRLDLRSPVWLLVAPTLLALLVADLSGLSKGEVERIWLPFAPWIMVATVTFALHRGWLAVSVATGFVLQLSLRSPW